MPRPTDSSLPPSYGADLEVRGSVPPALSGELVGIGVDGVVHSVRVGSGRVSYRRRQVRTDTVVHHLVAFAGAVLAFGDDSPAYELRPDLGALNVVDLAGHGRSAAPYPKRDPVTGDLHLLARGPDGTHHVVVSAGALTRHSRPIAASPRRVDDLVLSRDHLVLVGDGVIGTAAREGEPRTTWTATGTAALHPVVAYDDGGTVVVLALTPRLERWTLHHSTGAVEHEVLDPTPRSFARSLDAAHGVPRRLWTTGHGTIAHHDLATGRHTHHTLAAGRPGDLAVIADPAGDGEADGWLVGFVGAEPSTTRFVVIRHTDRVGPVVATVTVPAVVPPTLRCTWIPSGQT